MMKKDEGEGVRDKKTVSVLVEQEKTVVVIRERARVMNRHTA